MKVLIFVLSILMSGCTVKYVEIPAHLTEAMNPGAPAEKSVETAVDLANYRGEVIDKGNERFREIRQIQGTKVPKKAK